MAKCKVCGAPHKACGPRTTVIPVDERIEHRKQGDMSLQRYNVQSGRRGEHTITVKLTEAEAKRLGATPVDKKAAKAPANKSRTAANTSRTAANKKKAAPKPKAAKAPATAPAASGVEAASDPGASE